ncbi:MAG: radical SAM protein [Acidobacteriota bacterium]
MLLAPKRSAVYGPVCSRRLGRSLGINLLPPGRKMCTFDCLYCQYGWSDMAALERLDAQPLPSVDSVLGELEAALLQLAEPPAYLTFSGNGEPTLHPHFPALVDGVIALRNRLCPGARTAILSNSARVAWPAIRAALSRLDLRVMKLDAGDEVTFARVSRPGPGIRLAEVVDGLTSLRDVTLQSLFAGGPAGNAGASSVAAWLDAVVRIAPVGVQIYTLARDTPSRLIEALPAERLDAIAEAVRARGFPAQAF